MRKLIPITLLLSIVILSACGGSSNKEEGENNIYLHKGPLGALMKMSKNMEKQAKKMEKRQKEGKNVKALNYKALIKYLPTSIDGYKMNGEATGGSIEVTNMSYSSAEVKFKNDTSSIDITLLDYNNATTLYAASTAIWATGLKIDTPNEFAQSIKLDDDITGWEDIKKRTNQTTLFVGIGDRFLLSLKGSHQKNTDLLQSIAKSMDLDALKSLN